MSHDPAVPDTLGGPVASLIRIAVFFGTAALGITELLGALGLLTAGPVLLAWILTIPLAMRLLPSELERLRFGALSELIRGAPVAWGVVAVYVLGTFLTGIGSAPNSWDVLVYHLPRVEHWVDQGHLGFWPTSVDRQLWPSPWSAYAILHLRLITGGDWLAFLPSWLAYIGSILVTGLLVRSLGGSPRQVGFSALAMAALPVAILHASSAQADLPVAFWVLCVASLAINAWQNPGAFRDFRDIWWLGLAVGLAVATKGTAWLAVLPWLTLFGIAFLRNGGPGALVRPVLVGACALLILNGPHMARNVSLFGDPLGDPIVRAALQGDRLTPSWVLGNASANLSLNAGLPGDGWQGIANRTMTAFLTWLPGFDPESAFRAFGGFRVMPFSTHENGAGNPAHLLLLFVVGSMALMPLGRRWLHLLIPGLFGFLLFAAMIRWQPFGGRLQLPVLVWLPAAAAMVLSSRRTTVAFGGLLVALSASALYGNALRPLVPRGARGVFSQPRDLQYLAQRPSLGDPLRGAVEELGRSRCREVGVGAGYDFPEYLLRVEAQRQQHPIRLHYLNPPSISAGLVAASGGNPPCAVLVMSPPSGWMLPHAVADFELRYHREPVVVLSDPHWVGSGEPLPEVAR
jgi:4-amino-4-deoxy-L-arabinose transferase-like glycosyltransferase